MCILLFPTSTVKGFFSHGWHPVLFPASCQLILNQVWNIKVLICIKMVFVMLCLDYVWFLICKNKLLTDARSPGLFHGNACHKGKKRAFSLHTQICSDRTPVTVAPSANGPLASSTSELLNLLIIGAGLCLVLGAVLCTAVYAAASLASALYLPVASPSHRHTCSCDILQCLQTLPSVYWGAKSSLIGNCWFKSLCFRFTKCRDLSRNGEYKPYFETEF